MDYFLFVIVPVSFLVCVCLSWRYNLFLDLAHDGGVFLGYSLWCYGWWESVS